MALVLADRVKETSNTTGTGTFVLAGPSTGFQSFAVIGDANTTYYTIQNPGTNEWEVGIGTYYSANTSIVRTTVFSSSNANSVVSFSSGTKDVFVTYPSENAVTTLIANTFTNNQVISVNSSSNALTITQTGTGNALVVEDSTNPDSTPFVVDASGNVGIGITPTSKFNIYDANALSVVVESDTSTLIQATRYSDDTNGSSLTLRKTRGTRTSPTVVSDNDVISTINFNVYDGSTYRGAAQIQARVDGTPGASDTPGRLVFTTTADGASTTTERMRISNAGAVGIGTSGLTGVNLAVGKNITGSITGYGVRSTGQIQTDVTSQARMFDSSVSLASGSFTLTTLYHYYTSQGSIGGATVTNQIGYLAESTLTGATNNYGFYSDIASGTGRWNFYANGTAANYFAGNTTFASNVTVSGGANITGASTISGNLTTKLLTTTSGPFDSGTGATWTNPRTIASWATIELWGAGGGGGGSASGGAGGGGGGGAYFTITVPFSYLGTTETYTVGGGGANVSTNTNASAGGNTTFTVTNWPGGSKTFTAYGGGGGGGASSTSGYAGGGGGGVLSAGGTAAATIHGQGGQPLSAAQASGGGNEGYGGAAGSAAQATQGGVAYYGGGGGGNGENGTGTGVTGLGGNSVYGGGGGGGGNDSGTVRCPGGTSVFGGKGGDGGYGNNTTPAQDGTVPGGGGGGSDLGTAGSGNGASGRVLITIW